MIFEDPDELGYVMRPTSEEFGQVGWESLAECEGILPWAEQTEMKKAATYAFIGRHDAAERHRKQAGYAGMSFNDGVER